MLALDKPAGVSSNFVVQQLKRLFNAQKVGHTGSLDPMATGVLPIVFGEATKFSQYGLNSTKTYQTRVQLGKATDTLDADGTVVEICPIPTLTYESVSRHISSLIGKQQQMPPLVSALKQNGQPWYKLVRQGVKIERKTRKITVYSCKLLNFDDIEGWIDLKICCSKGTYIRSLAETLGAKLKSCAHLTQLRRINAGGLDISETLTLEKIRNSVETQSRPRNFELKSIDCILTELPQIHLSKNECIALIDGKKIPANGLQVCDTSRAYFDGHRFVGLVTVRSDGLVAPKRMVSKSAAGMRG